MLDAAGEESAEPRAQLHGGQLDRGRAADSDIGQVHRHARVDRRAEPANGHRLPERGGELRGHGGFVRDVTISEDGRRALTGSFDYTVIYGLTFLVIVAIGIATLILDLLLPKLDPRITY